jgi:signal transduction histidine kinase
VQESLTNARRHAPEATRITVRVEGAHDVVRVTVTDDGAAKAGARRGDGGFGLVGMAERVELLGGSMQAGPRPGGGWSVSARIPRPEPA